MSLQPLWYECVLHRGLSWMVGAASTCFVVFLFSITVGFSSCHLLAPLCLCRVVLFFCFWTLSCLFVHTLHHRSENTYCELFECQDESTEASCCCSQLNCLPELIFSSFSRSGGSWFVLIAACAEAMMQMQSAAGGVTRWLFVLFRNTQTCTNSFSSSAAAAALGLS